MDLELVAIMVLNGAILAFAVWILVRWRRARRRFRREASAQQAIAHWRYPANEWHLFCEAEAARIRRRDLPRLMTRYGGIVALLIPLVWLVHDPGKHYIFDPRLAMVILLAAIAVLLVLLALGRAYQFSRWRDLEYEVYVRTDGLLEVFRKHGEVLFERKTLFGPEYDLAGAVLRKEMGYSLLALTLRGHKGGKGEKRIPVPRGHEPQAERVAQTLKGLSG